MMYQVWSRRCGWDGVLARTWLAVDVVCWDGIPYMVGMGCPTHKRVCVSPCPPPSHREKYLDRLRSNVTLSYTSRDTIHTYPAHHHLVLLHHPVSVNNTHIHTHTHKHASSISDPPLARGQAIFILEPPLQLLTLLSAIYLNNVFREDSQVGL